MFSQLSLDFTAGSIPYGYRFLFCPYDLCILIFFIFKVDLNDTVFPEPYLFDINIFGGHSGTGHNKYQAYTNHQN
ncbi:hypothetical protein SDC9_210439 [bioreactor metagenome]|uniref:Uncharacterized protein n=1 Tax=bioreactor metagenome TaxID=1076179 RepID=A0A645JGW7_9ZZZZ